MATINTFGTATKQFGLIDPRSIRENRQRFRRDLFPELDLANSYYSVSGRWPDVGWLLIDRNSYNSLSTSPGIYSNTFQLTIGDFVNPALTISNISIVQARCVTRGLAADKNAIYLLQVTDNQGILYNPWFQFPVFAQYNVRSPGYDGNYYSGSLTGSNNTDAWTWSGMVGNLWGKATTFLGSYPGLPAVPNGAPDGWVFSGIPLWEAISRVMDYLGMAIAGRYPNYTIVVPGAADSSYSSQVTKYVGSLEDNMEYLDAGSGRVPSQVVVYFHRRNQYYGTEETVRYDSPQWQNLPFYSVTVAAPSTFTNALGTGYLWNEFTVRHDQEGNPIASDVTQAQAMAQDSVTDYFNTIYRGTQGFSKQVYAGVIPFTTGSLVDGIRWFNTGKLGTSDDRYCGWRTEVIRGYMWDEVTFQTTMQGLSGPK